MVTQHANRSKQSRSSKDTSPLYGMDVRDVIADIQNMNDYVVIAREPNGTVRVWGSDERQAKELYAETANHLARR